MKTSIVLAACIALSGCAVTKPRMDFDMFSNFKVDCSRQQEQRAFIDSMRSTPNERALAVFHLNWFDETLAAANGKKSQDRLAFTHAYDSVADALQRDLDKCPNALPRRDGVHYLQSQ